MDRKNSRRTSRSTSMRSSLNKSAMYSATVTVERTSVQKPANYAPTHHVNSPPTSFKNPWPSAQAPASLSSILHARFFNSGEKNFVPVPTDRSVLVPISTPDWGAAEPDSWTKLKATWIGHASFLVEFPSLAPNRRGVRVLVDPVFSERMSPVSFLGPKRFTPPPCTLEELPEVDLVCISHNHYDHCDAATIKFVQQRGKGKVKFLCGLGVGANLLGMNLTREEIVEMDWWDGVEISVQDAVPIGRLRVICTPSQHNSGRGVSDHGKTLWCSYVFESLDSPEEQDNTTSTNKPSSVGKKLFFAGDTAYRAIPQNATEEQISSLPVCSAFKEVGELYGPFDLSLLPIGCYLPRWWMSAVHCAPEDSICIHKDIRSKKSIGMHYGTVRGGISQYYEDVTEPPKRWKESCKKTQLKWGEEIGLCGVGETVLT